MAFAGKLHDRLSSLMLLAPIRIVLPRYDLLTHHVAYCVLSLTTKPIFFLKLQLACRAMALTSSRYRFAQFPFPFVKYPSFDENRLGGVSFTRDHFRKEDPGWHLLCQESARQLVPEHRHRGARCARPRTCSRGRHRLGLERVRGLLERYED